MSVVIETTIGDLTVDLYLKERPNTCLNFLKLCKIKYYNLCLFHKVESNFVAQTGDPTTTGRGGESVFSHLYGEQAKYFDSELKPRIKHEKMGTLSMVNNGNNMNGSQFFLTLGENLTFLDEVHTVFGEVVEGFDILLKLNEAICDQNNRPYQDIRITHTIVLHDPYDDPPGLEIPDASPEPTKEMLETDYIAPDEEIDDTKGKDVEEIEEKIKESEAKARATILEMVGDIPDADVRPPENVLFVCKLNPVTESKDLKVIFSRFGPIVSCEVIKDKTTGESLQYAFIEFEKEEDCENAYFKMDNVLIDDRRIHVDFSQSVSKLNLKNKFSKGKSDRTQNFVLKNAKTDGYEMVFDTEGDSNQLRSKDVDKYKKSYSHSKKSNHSNYSENYTRRLSNSPEKRSHKYKESRSNEKQYRSKHSRSPSPARSSQKSKRYRSRSPHYKDSRSYYDTKGKDRMSSYSISSSAKSDKSKHLPRTFKSSMSHHKKKYTSSDSDSSEPFSSKKSAMSSSYSKSTVSHKMYEKNIKSKQTSRNRSQSRSPEYSKHKTKSSHVSSSHKHVKQYKKRSSTSEDSSSSESESSKRKSYKSKSSNSHYKHLSHQKHLKKDARHRRSSS